MFPYAGAEMPTIILSFNQMIRNLNTAISIILDLHK
ncbi:hypothetical protein CLOL250_01352 [Clostridium sp. L2-50]|nr:hypothetical protein CLOL250_01352 [Clostridium sp. L2-50]